jgi:hypothetical protein
MRASLLALTLLAVFPADRMGTPSVSAVWFSAGHRVVVRLALLRLTPHTIAAMRDLLGGQDPVEASLWADQVRGSRRDTGALHFVNIPLDATAYDPATQCPEGRCIIAAIEHDRAILADEATPLPERAEALRFLLHLVGDLHQPLHVSDNDDRGGNQTEVSLFDRVTNLHKVWDGELIERAGLDEEAYFARLKLKMEGLDVGALERGSVVDWAMEGHRVAVEHAYRLPRGNNLGQAYLDDNLPRMDLAIIEAGVRLARVLNEALSGYHPAPLPASLGTGVYSDREAAAHEGEEATVVGVVVSVHRTKGGNIFLNFGADYPHQTFSAAILDPHDPALLSLDRLTGKTVGIRGRITRYKGSLEIVVETKEQIVEGM